MMNEVVESVRRLSGIIAEITAASVEQISGIDQGNSGITQMEKASQPERSLDDLRPSFAYVG